MAEKLALCKMASCNAPALSKGCCAACEPYSLARRMRITRSIRTYSSARKASNTMTLPSISLTAVLDCAAVFKAIPPTSSKTINVIPKPVNSNRSVGTLCIVFIISPLIIFHWALHIPGKVTASRQCIAASGRPACGQFVLALAHIRQEAPEFFLDYTVAFADRPFQADPVNYRDMSSAIADWSTALQFSGGLSHAFTTHAKHVGDQFLGHGQFIRRQAVERQQEPAAQLLFYRMMAVAQSCLRHVGDQCLRVTQQQPQHRTGAFDFFHQDMGFESITVAASLHNRPAWSGVAAHEQCNPQHSLIADTGYFGRPSVFEQVMKGYDGGCRNVNIMQFSSRFI